MPDHSTAGTNASHRTRPAGLLPLLPNPPNTHTLPDQIAASLQAAILAGRLKAGARLVEAGIAEQMRTSRGPVRDALLLLERDGLIEKLPNRGARVLNFNARALREATTLRAALEEFAVMLLVPCLTPRHIQCLGGLIEKMESAARRNAVREFNMLDYRFHDAMCEACGHQMLHEVWRGMARRIQTFLGSSNLASGNLQAVAGRHRAIYLALAARKRADARRTIRAHFIALQKELAQVVRGSGMAEPNRRGDSAIGRSYRNPRAGRQVVNSGR
jgi:DNA-binding GntR family transcriptional regulator